MPTNSHYSLADLYPVYKLYIAKHLAPRCRRCGHYGPPVTLDGYVETQHALNRLMHVNPLDDLSDISDEAYGAVCWVAVRAVGTIVETMNQQAAPAVMTEHSSGAPALTAVMQSIWPLTIHTEIALPDLPDSDCDADLDAPATAEPKISKYCH